ncbi:MAG: hypothetical protein LBI19_03690 [Oscillospiraceae bacterium]|jgi:hypothetical protein|nr:hypothetical protein [Oscillospiraceae bacterium]
MKTTVLNHKKLLVSVALLLAALIAVAALATTMGKTMAKPDDVIVTLRSESGIPEAFYIEAGTTKNVTVSNLHRSLSSNTTLATVLFEKTGTQNLHITGKKAGVVTISSGTTMGAVSADRYQIINSNNISVYTIQNGGVIQFNNASGSASIPVTVVQGNDNIVWQSTNEAVAQVSGKTVTAKAKGVALIVGKFTDKWGVDRDIHILTGVGVDLGGGISGGGCTGGGDGNCTDPDCPKHGCTDPGCTDPDCPTCTNPNCPIHGGNGAGNGGNCTDPNCPEHGNWIKGPDGNWYRPDGGSNNIWENGGNSAKPNPSEPPVYVWGGEDKNPGTSDDKQPVIKDGSDYWVHIGQNVWQKVDKDNPTELLFPLTGGGPDENPAKTPGTPIYEWDNIYYIGPLGPDMDGYTYYYGDKKYQGDGKLQSLDGYLFSATDEKYYLHNGQMTTEKPAYAITKVTIDSPLPGHIATKGSALFFETTVSGVGNQSLIPQDVIFQVIANGGTTSAIVSYDPVVGNPYVTGTVLIPVAEPADAVIVRVMSKADPRVYADYILKMTDSATIGGSGGGSSQLSVSPGNVIKKAGGCQNFKAYNAGKLVSDSKVNWSVIGATSSKTHINACGTLHIGSDEQGSVLVVRAALKENTSIYADATVTVIR